MEHSVRSQTTDLPGPAAPDADEARLRISYPEGHAGHSFDVRYLPPSNFDFLRNEVTVRTGRPRDVTVVDDNGELRGVLEIEAFGKQQAAWLLRELELDDSSPGLFIYEIPETFSVDIPKTYAGVGYAKRVDNRIVRVGWSPPGDFPADRFYVSLAPTEEQLFTKTAETIGIADLGQRWTEIPYEGSGFAGVRLGNQTETLEENSAVVSFSDAPAETTGSVAELSIEPSEVIGRRGETFSIQADVVGDPGVEWTVVPSDAGHVADPGADETTLTLGSKPGNLVLRSTADPTAVPVSMPIYPDVVSGADLNANVVNVGDGESVRITWQALDDDPGDPQITYRVYWNVGGPVQDTERADQCVQTERTQLTLRGLPTGKDVYVRLVAEDRAGNRTVSRDNLVVTTEAFPSRPAVLRMAPLRSYEVAPGTSVDVPLIGHFLPVLESDLDEDLHEDALAAAVDETQIDVFTAGGHIEATVDDGTLRLRAPSTQSPGPDQTVVLVRFRREKHVPIWASLCASVGEVSRKTAYNWSGVHNNSLTPEMRRLHFEDLVGPDWSARRQNAFDDDLRRLTHSLVIADEDWHDPEVQVAAVSDEPGILVLHGSDGWGTVTLSCDASNNLLPPPLPMVEYDTYQLPAAYVEVDRPSVPSRYAPFDMYDLLTAGDSLKNVTWRRLLEGEKETVGSKLYDVSRVHRPKEVHYDAPVFYGGRWFDYNQYPDDVSATLQTVGQTRKQQATYRAGLFSPAAEPTVPIIEDLQATSTSTSVSIVWNTFSPLDSDQELADLPIPVRLKAEDQTDTTTGQTGYGRVNIGGLIPNTTYTAQLGDIETAVVRFSTKRHLPDIKVVGQILEPGWYQYEYQVTQHPDADEPYVYWDDPFGQRHFESSAVVTSEGQPIDEHQIVIGYQGDDVQRSVTATWKAPSGPIEFARSVQVGQYRPAGKSDSPVFTRLQYSGTNTRDLEHNVYEPGTHRTKLIGALPPTIPGRLEDYCEAVFVSPNGQELGSSVTLQMPTELGIRLRVSAFQGETPQITGVRVVHNRQ